MSVPNRGGFFPHGRRGGTFGGGPVNVYNDGEFSAEVSDAGTTTAPTALEIRHRTSATAGTGFGVSLDFYGEDDAGNDEVQARLKSQNQDATSGSEDTILTLMLRAAGAALADAVVFRPAQLLIPAGSTASPGLAFTTSEQSGFSWAIGPPADRIRVSIGGTEYYNFRPLQMMFPSGAAATPAMAFTASTGTGFYFNPLGTVGFCLGGAEILTMAGDRLTFNAAGGNTRFECGDIYFGRDPTNGSARIQSAKGVVVGSLAALATNATDGFLWIPSCAGPPTGTPTAYTGKLPLVYDSNSDDLLVYNPGDSGWRKIPLFDIDGTPESAALTNNITAGGTNDTFTNWSDLTTYATDAAAIRNAVYQLARAVKRIDDNLRTLELQT